VPVGIVSIRILLLYVVGEMPCSDPRRRCMRCSGAAQRVFSRRGIMRTRGIASECRLAASGIRKKLVGATARAPRSLASLHIRQTPLSGLVPDENQENELSRDNLGSVCVNAIPQCSPSGMARAGY
jgi:hypothetical protein